MAVVMLLGLVRNPQANISDLTLTLSKSTKVLEPPAPIL